MSTSVKIRDKDKERLDRIKAKLTLRGIKLNQEQLLGKIISIAEASPLLFDELEFKSVSNERKQEILAKSYALGSTREETIDDDLYGDQ
jgi:hypothetical protein